MNRKNTLLPKVFAWALCFVLIMSIAPVHPVIGADTENDSVWDGTADASWYNPLLNTFAIDTAEKLAGLARLVNNGADMAGKTINLTADIYLNPFDGSVVSPDHHWISIGTEEHPFKGTFDGNGHTILGMRISEQEHIETVTAVNPAFGFFGHTDGNAHILNIDFKYCTIITDIQGSFNGSINAGGVVGYNRGRIEKCSFSGEIINRFTNTGLIHVMSRTGGIVGYQQGSSISNAVSHTNVSASGLADIGGTSSAVTVSIGGICGTASNTYFNYLYSTGNISTQSRDNMTYIGGIAGMVNAMTTTFRACYRSGTANQGINGAPDTTFARTEADMKTREFANFLGDAFVYIPGQYPVLAALQPVGVPPIITTQSLPNGRIGSPYHAQLAATGDTPITWSVDTGRLPNGLSLSTSGVISGTPAAADTFAFVIRATNSAGSDTNVYAITISSSSDPVQNGWWQSPDGFWFYYINGEPYKGGWLDLRNTWYYFDTTGRMHTGWLFNSNKWYFFAESGAMQKGWVLHNDTWYNFDSSGAMHIGWLRSGNLWYYLSPTGAMITGWFHENGKWYYFDDDSGAMLAHGTYDIDGKPCFFDSDGAWIPIW